MTTQTNVELGFPLRLYSLGCEPEPKRSINYHSKTEFLKNVKTVVGEKVWSDICATSLGVVLRFVELDFTWSSKLVKHLLVRQLVCKKKYELWCLFGGTPARFSLSEFKDITTLNCAPFPDSEDASEANAHVALWRKINVDEKKNPSKKKLMNVLQDVRSWSDEKDKTRFAYLSILATVIIGNDWKTELPSPLARMVFDLSKFERYPWGKVAFENLIKSVKGLNMEADTYTLHGFLQVLQIWAYTVVPRLGAAIGRPLNVEGPPLLRFKGTKGKGNNIDIEAISDIDKENIKSVVINELAPTSWKHDVEDIEIDTLLQAICKEEGLGVVIWSEHGSKSIQVGKNKEEKLVIDGSGKATENKGDGGDAENVSLKRPIEMRTEERKRMKAMEYIQYHHSQHLQYQMLGGIYDHLHPAQRLQAKHHCTFLLNEFHPPQPHFL
ncbi:hypothetical protein V5N11_016062 [Cardamine amara subsp. amara]|uniref:DUF1985 domain-containing protein n=1 Tax=Cardamine amara subsp. amara TaxID=228776 RepID=A0ABD1BIG2_CARAN